jgi:hypothetical protein
MATAPATGAGMTVARSAAEKVKEGGEAVASTARRTPGPLRAVGFAAAGLAGGLAIGARIAPRRKPLGFLPHSCRTVLGMPVGRASASVAAARALAGAGRRASRTAEDIHEIREHLEQANRQSPIEVLLNGLTHRRGAHRTEH